MRHVRRQEPETVNAQARKNFLPLPLGEGRGEGAKLVTENLER